MTHTLFVMCAALTSVISGFLIVSCEYEDGLFGRVALILISLSELVIVMDWVIQGTTYGGILPTTLILQIGVTLFFIRHAYRFLRWRSDGSYEWREAKK